MQLTDLEKNLLYVITREGGQVTEKELAKKLNKNIDTIRYKIKRFEEKGVIKGYMLRLNHFKIGGENIAWVFLSLKKYKEFEELMREFLKYENVLSVEILTGLRDIVIKLLVKDFEQILELLMDIEERFSDIVKDYKISFNLRVFKMHDIILRKEDLEPAKIDKIDREILGVLKKEPLLKIKEVAERLGLHRNTVSKKMKNLWKRKIILKKSPKIDPRYFGDIKRRFISIVEIEFVTGFLTNLVDELIKMEEVHDLYLTENNELLAVILTKNIEHFYELHRTLRTKYDNYIVKTVSNIVLKAAGKEGGL